MSETKFHLRVLNRKTGEVSHDVEVDVLSDTECNTDCEWHDILGWGEEYKYCALYEVKLDSVPLGTGDGSIVWERTLRCQECRNKTDAYCDG